ncbi:hypothetical protein T492DRAFT_864027 [Pavlovales sp. CCMP2436]|nr:hypothetical protein T492DRAFT_864027 [Pavlovales sp. CCMP2436]
MAGLESASRSSVASVRSGRSVSHQTHAAQWAWDEYRGPTSTEVLEHQIALRVLGKGPLASASSENAARRPHALPSHSSLLGGRGTLPPPRSAASALAGPPHPHLDGRPHTSHGGGGPARLFGVRPEHARKLGDEIARMEDLLAFSRTERASALGGTPAGGGAWPSLAQSSSVKSVAGGGRGGGGLGGARPLSREAAHLRLRHLQLSRQVASSAGLSAGQPGLASSSELARPLSSQLGPTSGWRASARRASRTSPVDPWLDELSAPSVLFPTLAPSSSPARLPPRDSAAADASLLAMARAQRLAAGAEAAAEFAARVAAELRLRYGSASAAPLLDAVAWQPSGCATARSEAGSAPGASPAHSRRASRAGSPTGGERPRDGRGVAARAGIGRVERLLALPGAEGAAQAAQAAQTEVGATIARAVTLALARHLRQRADADALTNTACSRRQSAVQPPHAQTHSLGQTHLAAAAQSEAEGQGQGGQAGRREVGQGGGSVDSEGGGEEGGSTLPPTLQRHSSLASLAHTIESGASAAAALRRRKRVRVRLIGELVDESHLTALER